MAFGPMKGMNYSKTFEQIRQHVQSQGYFVTDALLDVEARPRAVTKP